MVEFGTALPHERNVGLCLPKPISLAQLTVLMRRFLPSVWPRMVLKKRTMPLAEKMKFPVGIGSGHFFSCPRTMLI